MAGASAADKAALFSEVRRVLVSEGRFGVYDVMRVGPGEVVYPLPWAVSCTTSFLDEPTRYRQLLAKAGLAVQAQRDRRSFVLNFLHEMQARIAREGPPALGLHIVMGSDAALKIANMVDNLQRSVLAPIEMICLAQ